MYFLRMKHNSLFHSFRYAAHGIKTCMKEERNFRIHMAAACYSSALGIYMDLDRTQWAVLLLLQSLVLSLELVNTAVEAVVDLCCPQQSFLAARAKDAAAGAVLVAAIFSVGVGANLFFKPKLWNLAEHIFTSPSLFLAVFGSVIFFIWFIFPFGENRNREQKLDEK